MSKRSVLLIGTGLLVLAILSSQIPAINSRLARRYQVAKTYAKNVINPIGDVPTAVPNPTSTKASASQTEVPSATHAVTETAMSPAATPAPIPVQALLDSPPYEQQTPNNCGLYCGACPIMLNTKTGPGTEQCYGCKSEQPTGYCAVCGIKACARGKGYEFCNECSEYSTRELMQKFPKDSNWPYQQIVSNNMESIQRNGLSKWLEAQEQRWRCADCGASHSWWDETCPQCGRAVASYKADI